MLVYFLSSCAVARFPRPEYRPPPSAAEREVELSEFEVPFTANLGPLSEKAETLVPKELVSDGWEKLASSPVGDVGVRYKLWRGPLEVAVRGNAVSVTVRGKYWLEAGHKIRAGLIPGLGLPWTPFASCGKGDEPPREIVFTVETALSWGDEWRIEPTTRILPNAHPVRCRIASLDLDVTKPMDDQIARRLSAVAEMADKYLRERLDLKAAVRDTWARAGGPVEIDKDVWLQLNPECLHVTPIVGDDKTMETRIVLSARPVASAGKAPPYRERPLPPFAVGEPGKGTFSVAVKGEISFEAAGRQLTKSFSEATVGSDGKKIRVEQAAVYPSGELAVLQLRVSGSFSGLIFLTGRPAFDGATLSLEGLDYAVETRNVLEQANEWLLHGDLRQKLAKLARFNVVGEAENARAKLEKSLNRRINGNLALEAKINSLAVTEVNMTADGFRTLVLADGSARMVFE
ncbi:MAG: DUF4403 family protein [Nitrospinae bacterium]|nr:DUF4403 family protein [Nitrospinota bacterium]